MGNNDGLAGLAGLTAGPDSAGADRRVAVVLLDVADLEQAQHPGVDQGTVAGQPAELDPQAGRRGTRPGGLEHREGRTQGSLVVMSQAARPIELGHDEVGAGQDPHPDRLERRIGQDEPAITDERESPVRQVAAGLTTDEDSATPS